MRLNVTHKHVNEHLEIISQTLSVQQLLRDILWQLLRGGLVAIGNVQAAPLLRADRESHASDLVVWSIFDS